MAKKVLIVDDEESLCNNLKKFLTIKGYQVATATTSTEGFKQIKEFEPEFLLLDLHLSERITGIEMIKKAKSMKPDLKIIILTGFRNDEETVNKCLRLGAVKFLCKPLTASDIKQTLDDIK